MAPWLGQAYASVKVADHANQLTMNQYKIKLIKNFTITIEVEADNAITAERQAEWLNPGYTSTQITWLNAPASDAVVPRPRAARKPRVVKTQQ